VLFVLCLAAAGCGANDDWGAARGEEVYLEHCSSCHQPDGEGYDGVYPNLANNPIVRLEDPDPVLEVVLHGRGSMPSFAGTLTNHELAAVVSYIRSAWGNDAPGVTPAQAK